MALQRGTRARLSGGDIGSLLAAAERLGLMAYFIGRSSCEQVLLWRSWKNLFPQV